MPKFGLESLKARASLHPELQRLLDEAIKFVDFKILCGYRGQVDQHRAFLDGASEKDWPNSRHNTMPAEAADVVLYFPVVPHMRWTEKESQYMFIGFLRGLAHAKDILLRCGADWDGDFDVKDQKFNDIVHVELGG